MTNQWTITVFLTAFILSTQVATAGGFKADSRHLPVTVLFNGSQCDYTQTIPQVKLLATQTEVNAFVKNNRKAMLGASKSTDIPSIDFSREVVAAVWMGKKSTAGHQIDLGKQAAEIKGEIAVVQVDFIAPDAQAVRAQIMTSPCLLIKLPKDGYDTINILSQEGHLLGTFAVRK